MTRPAPRAKYIERTPRFSPKIALSPKLQSYGATKATRASTAKFSIVSSSSFVYCVVASCL